MSSGGRFDIGIPFRDYDPTSGQDHTWVRGFPHKLRDDPYIWVCTKDVMYRYSGVEVKHREKRPKWLRDGTKVDAGPGYGVWWDLTTKRRIPHHWRSVPGRPKAWSMGIRYMERGSGGPGPGAPARFRIAVRGDPKGPVAIRTDFDDSDWNRTFAVRGTEAREAKRQELELIIEYRKWRHLARSACSPYRLEVAGGPSLVCDAFLHHDNALIEAKASASREAIRMAIGQLCDYRRFFERRPTLAILVPRAPEPDLMALLKTCGIEVVWRTGRQFFSSTSERLVTR